jgi:2-polyprenyl-3-methyl-5-hydroxy-6-metoxy-1,4-benzoquinol methylase
MNLFKFVFRNIRKIFTIWISKYDLEHLHRLRQVEFKFITSFFPNSLKKSVLEIGAGTGWQAKLLSESGFEVSAIDLPSSNYSNNRVWNIINYDGVNIPFNNESFDIVFSSNVMEHVLHINKIQNEIYRVLKNDGIVIHVMPTPTWRVITNFSHIIKFWSIPSVHGVHSNNVIDEKLFFSKKNWIKILNEKNFSVQEVFNIPILYSGNSIFGNRLNLKIRSQIAHWFGGSCNIYILKKNKNA